MIGNITPERNADDGSVHIVVPWMMKRLLRMAVESIIVDDALVVEVRGYP
jgi:hypothetical protein